MVCVMIGVAKDTQGCFILSSDGKMLADVFTITKKRDGFDSLMQRIRSCARTTVNIKVGLVATGHYSYNILGFLLVKGLPTFGINPLHNNLYRKSLSLCQAKTDQIDARTNALMLMFDVDLKSYTDTAYHNKELKSLTRYRFARSGREPSLSSPFPDVNILFPELKTLVPSLHMASCYAVLCEFPGAKQIADATHLTHFKTVLTDASKGHYGWEKALENRKAARRSVVSAMFAKSLELQHTIRITHELEMEIVEIEAVIKAVVDEMSPLILTIPGISYRMGAMILAEIGDFSRFDSSDKLLAYAGLSPSTHESVKLKATGTYAHMEKRDSRYQDAGTSDLCPINLRQSFPFCLTYP